MNFVSPIKNEKTIEDIAGYLKKKNERDWMMFMVGIHSGLRISDILPIKVRDVKGQRSLNIKEKKTGKYRVVPITKELRKMLANYCENKDPEAYLFKSRQKYNKPISRDMAYKILRDAAEKFGLYNIGTHTMRKTFGYHFYKKYGDIVTLQEIFNHSHPRVTMRYIGLNEESIELKFKSFKYDINYT